MVLILLFYGYISVKAILLLIIGQYVIATICAYRFLKESQANCSEVAVSFKQMINEYWIYCSPLIGLSLVGFLYNFSDKWLLQKFGGALQQGYFQIATQFSSVSLLATSSILSVFWKEIAESWAKRDYGRAGQLYRRVNRGLVMLGAATTGLVLPWSENIVSIMLGQAYVQAWPVLAIMLLYPIHQSMGQIGGTMLLASGHTRKYMVVSMIAMIVSIPLTYVVLAPTTDIPIPGMGFGAIGLASKIVLTGMVSVNVQAWVISRYSGLSFDWKFQLFGIPLMLGLGYLAKALVGLHWSLNGVGMGRLAAPVMLASLVYALSVIVTIWLLPWLIGLDKDDISIMITKFRKCGVVNHV